MKRILVIIVVTAACGVAAGVLIYLHPSAEKPPDSTATSPTPVIDIAALKTKAEQGDANSQSQLGKAFTQGEGVPMDFKQAAHWYGLAASNGNVEAEAAMGELCQAGQGVPLDGAAAERWFTKAGEHGSVAAQYDLGYMYERGQGAKRDQKAAARWYQLAAEGGDALAQYNYGQRCILAIGAAKDPVEGFKWFLLAAAQGQTDAQAKLESVKSGLTPDQVSEAKKRAAAFKRRSAGQ